MALICLLTQGPHFKIELRSTNLSRSGAKTTRLASVYLRSTISLTKVQMYAFIYSNSRWFLQSVSYCEFGVALCVDD